MLTFIIYIMYIFIKHTHTHTHIYIYIYIYIYIENKQKQNETKKKSKTKTIGVWKSNICGEYPIWRPEPTSMVSGLWIQCFNWLDFLYVYKNNTHKIVLFCKMSDSLTFFFLLLCLFHWFCFFNRCFEDFFKFELHVLVIFVFETFWTALFALISDVADDECAPNVLMLKRLWSSSSTRERKKKC